VAAQRVLAPRLDLPGRAVRPSVFVVVQRFENWLATRKQATVKLQA
jgi:hypothetical protein